MDYKQLLERVKEMREKIYNGTVVGTDSVNFCETLDYVVNFINIMEQVTKINSQNFSEENKKLQIANENLINKLQEFKYIIRHYENIINNYKNLLNK